MTTKCSVFAFFLTLALSTQAYSKSAFIKSKSLKEAQKAFENSNMKVESVFPDLGLYKVSPKASENKNISTQALTESVSDLLYKTLGRSTNIKLLEDPMMHLRESLPSDAQYDEQWSMNSDLSDYSVKVEDAWDITTGGQNALGQEIVIAVVDGGFSTDHKDLIDNIWVNKGEIPDNGIDDDENGYVDDVVGWNVLKNSGKHQRARHGAHVAGTMGATGNDIGVVGVNWNVKIMMVSMGYKLAHTSDTMRAYSYILDQKKLWIESNGKRGANVVAINSSFGRDRADCSSPSYIAWDEMFDKLGEYGILSVGATANSSFNIDSTGDVPTSCSSDFLVSVTNSTKTGERNSYAGYGTTTIDLAAPGTDILSTVLNNKFSTSTGTSMATPHVTGAIGLLHSAASKDFAELYNTNPAEAALILKDILLTTVTPTEELQDEIVSGGILNLGQAATTIHAFKNNNPEDPTEGEGNDSQDGKTEDSSEVELKTFKKSVNKVIPDSFWYAGVLESSLRLPKVSNLNEASISFKIEHENFSDLNIQLVTPSGKTIQLVNRDYVNKTSVIMTFDFNELSKSLKTEKAGRWTLKIEDQSWLSEGVLKEWSMTVPVKKQ